MNLMNQCYICLESTDTIAVQNCKCIVYTHNSCYEEWMRHKEICLICKKSLYGYTPFSISNISTILETVDPIINSFMHYQMNGFEFLMFLFLSFLATILLVTPLCMIIVISKKYQFRKIRFERRTAC